MALLPVAMPAGPSQHPSVAVLIPCLNEDRGIASVVAEFRRELPEARIVVVDNGSTDATARVASDAGAEVWHEPRRGKGRAITTAFARIEEDVVVMVDGDGSYPAAGGRLLLAEYLRDPADMITGLRTPDSASAAFRPLHRFGGAAFAWVFRLVFRYEPGDLFSGLRLFSKRFYKNVPILFRGFELETELTVQGVEKGFRLAELAVPFSRARGRLELQAAHRARRGADPAPVARPLARLPAAGVLRRDRAAVLRSRSRCRLAADRRVRAETRLVGRFPLAILAAALMNLSLFTLLTGVMLESGLRHRRESYQIALRNYKA